ncbi:tyrosine-protein phosphatase [Lactonifactor longoviformis]|uniref:tyrosine-protein phosphatase n=1 Tax=Lactonifactor longoviformis TaxID=341220 RepID=UPI002108D614|nr:tyrosine-protein phosphatase [Lactonifactor longoviformis]MCQ4670170.1 tyrosine-protein phosphatase [Lactonifactor longoviformis]
METRIELENLYNTRDLGGYRTLEGKKIRPKRLLRSGTLERATDRDIRTLTDEYQMKTVVDFRTRAEMDQKPDPPIEGVTFIHNPILTEAQMGITREEENNAKSFMNMLMEYTRKIQDNPMAFGEDIYPQLVTNEESVYHYRRFFEILLEQEEGAVLWHCTAGKDRVGTGTALLLSALNVDRETILQDYMLTNTYIEPETQRMQEMVSRFTTDPVVFRTLRVLNGVERGYLESVFQTIDRVYGSLKEFLENQMGLNRERRMELCHRYLTE